MHEVPTNVDNGFFVFTFGTRRVLSNLVYSVHNVWASSLSQVIQLANGRTIGEVDINI